MWVKIIIKVEIDLFTRIKIGRGSAVILSGTVRKYLPYSTTHFMCLYQLFKEQLEKPDQLGGELLDTTEIRLIFGHLPPIYEVHKKINRELANLIVHWNETHCIGNVWLSHVNNFCSYYCFLIKFFIILFVKFIV